MAQIASIAIVRVNRNEREIPISVKVVYFDSNGEEVSSHILPAHMFEEMPLDRPTIELKFVEKKKE